MMKAKNSFVVPSFPHSAIPPFIIAPLPPPHTVIRNGSTQGSTSLA